MNTADRFNEACDCHKDIDDAYQMLCHKVGAPDYLKKSLSQAIDDLYSWCNQLENEIDPDDLHDGSHPSLTASERNPNLR
tara:strand:- start:150 stop:389 length:240 start_codon:yes stop_codon:yes gene_type:complete